MCVCSSAAHCAFRGAQVLKTNGLVREFLSVASLSVLDSATNQNAICVVVSACHFVFDLRLARRQAPAELVLVNQTHLEVPDDQKKYPGGNWRGSGVPVCK